LVGEGGNQQSASNQIGGNVLVKLSKAIVEKTAPEAKEVFLWDSELRGFGCKITPAGKRVYVAQYRINGRVRRLTIGRHGTLTIEQARKRAGDDLAKATLGSDPQAQKLDLRHGPTLRELGIRYLSEHAEQKKKKSSAAGDRWLLDKVIYTRFENEKVSEVTRADVAEFHHSLKDRPYIANRSIALLSKMLSLAEAWGYRADNTNPCRHVEKFREAKRRRFLSVEELGRVGAALAEAEKNETEPAEAIAAIRLLLFTGARLSEILTLEWSFVDWKLGALVLPDSKTGFKTIALNAPAREVLEKLPVLEGNKYVLPGHRKHQHFVSLGHIWDRIRKTAEIPDVRIHDLRHSYGSVGAAAGLGLPVIGALLGHTEASTTQRYAHLAQDPLKAATEMIGQRIDKALRTKPKRLRRVK
jgi:integrase